MNLVDIVQEQLGGTVLTRLAETLGTSPGSTRTAANAAIPTLLSALGTQAATRYGARNLASAVDSLDDRVLDNLPQSLNGGGGASLNLGETGTRLFDSLLGGSTLSSLSSVLSRFTGLGSGSMSSLLTMLAPIVLGVLKQRTQGRGSDANALTSLFEEQRQNISNAMPAGLSDQLTSIPSLRGAAEWTRSTASSAYQAGQVAMVEAGSTARDTAAAGASALRWTLPVLAVLLVAGLLWWWGSKSTVQQTAPVIPPSLVPDQVTRLTGQLTDFFRSATDTLTSIKDTASAETAVPKLQELSTTLDTMRVALNQLPDDARAKLVALVQELGTKLMATLDAVMAMPVVSNTIKPFVDELRSKLQAMGVA